MKEYKVYAIWNDEKYGLIQVFYKDDRRERIEISDSITPVIFKSREDAKKAIEIHKRTRVDQKVEKYIISKV